MKKMSIEAKKAANGGKANIVSHCNICGWAVEDVWWARSIHDSVCHPGRSSWTDRALW